MIEGLFAIRPDTCIPLTSAYGKTDSAEIIDFGLEINGDHSIHY